MAGIMGATSHFVSATKEDAANDAGKQNPGEVALLAKPKTDYKEESEKGHDFGERVRGMILGTAKDVVRPVLMPVQYVGKQGRAATIGGLAKSLPGIVRRAVPTLQAELDEKLRKMAAGTEDANSLLPPDIQKQLALRIELDQPLDAPIIEVLQVVMTRAHRAVKREAARSNRRSICDPSAARGARRMLRGVCCAAYAARHMLPDLC